ncbi:protein FAR-RED IMPAIRED RESPONSE 1 isoform X2 [Diospyros lotus]|uniref:protein FAR-RED IMPAIRED RESPONSE 1 isoform X2 n=1 Tax=Diospyros lotus TaxID=55363 RepID=UPI00225BFAD2|nr:protein FAR-RED IMPAIRED RESPONSE 1 isoform X2 [Diospyros lotus]
MKQTLAAAFACSSLPLACVSVSSSSPASSSRPSSRPLFFSSGSSFSLLRPTDCRPRRRRPEFSHLNEGNSDMEPYLGMQFESEEAAKVFYDAYATRLGFIMRVDAFRRSMRDGKVVWRRLVCNKEGFRKCRPRRSEGRKPRAVTREGCKAMIVVKKEKTGKWVVTRFVKEHSHPLVVAPANSRRSVLLSQTPDEKDVKIRELTAELHRERKKSAALQEQLDTVLKEMEDHSNLLSRNIDDIVRSVREIESKRIVLPHN